tara:strand:+ start:66406 stop:66600 length:195 start_codon:yes stop_codon:yes gene_type:complete
VNRSTPDEDDGLLTALKRAITPTGFAIFNEQRPEGNRTPLALNDDVGIARILGMPIDNNHETLN